MTRTEKVMVRLAGQMSPECIRFSKPEKAIIQAIALQKKLATSTFIREVATKVAAKHVGKAEDLETAWAHCSRAAKEAQVPLSEWVRCVALAYCKAFPLIDHLRTAHNMGSGLL